MKKYTLKIMIVTLFLAVTGLALFQVERAQAEDLMPQQTENTSGISAIEVTHPPIELTPDRSELVHLEETAATVIVGNPQHLTVSMDNTKLLVLTAERPGATHLTVMGRDGGIIMQRFVHIAPPKQKYVRIRRNCTSDDCEATSFYYCPGICHEVLLSSYEQKLEDATLRKENAEAYYDEARADSANAAVE